MRAAAIAALLLASFTSSAAAATRLVDDDKAECPNAPFTGIQAAVDNAEPNDTVAICPGLYPTASPIAIAEPLTLRGAGAELVRIEPSASFDGGVISATGGGPVLVSGVTIAGNHQAFDYAVDFADTAGRVDASRLTALADDAGTKGNGIRSVNAATARTLDVTGTLIEGYGGHGVRMEGSTLTGTVSDSVVRGRGTLNGTFLQDGVQVIGSKALIHDNFIGDNRNTSDESRAAGVRVISDTSVDTAITDNDIQGNGYGVANLEVNNCERDPSAPDVDATGNWWGNPAGATSEPRGVLCLPVTGSPSAGDRITGNVDASSPLTAPRGAPVAPAAQADASPAVAITSPADGTAAEPGSPVTVSATATDDFDVKRVEFRRGTTLLATTSAPPSYSATVTAPAAGTSQVVTATAFDSSGQTAVAAISLRGTLPPEQPATPQQPDTPQAPAEPEDRPPTVAITGPAPGSQIDPAAAPRITADAADDRGVARVVFFDDGQQVCSDDTAPYDCAYAPNGGDVGRNTLIAIAVDGAGQGAVDFRGVEVRRFNPQLTARTTPKRDRRRPYRYTTTGSVLLPTGVTPAQACSGGGSVAIEFRAGKLRLPMTATLRSDCSFRTSIAFPSRRSLGSGRIAVTAKFGGNTVLGTAKARSQKVRAG